MASTRQRLFLSVLLLFVLWTRPAMLSAQGKVDFSGVWRQDNARSQPARTGEVTLRIVHHDPDLSVETTILRPGRPTQHAVQRYTTDGKESTSTGADGDTFMSRIVWSGNDLSFSIVEHEDDRTITSSEVWSLLDGANTLKRVRRSSKFTGDQTIFYTRQK